MSKEKQNVESYGKRSEKKRKIKMKKGRKSMKRRMKKLIRKN